MENPVETLLTKHKIPQLWKEKSNRYLNSTFKPIDELLQNVVNKVKSYKRH